MLGQGHTDKVTEVPGNLTGLIETTFTLASWMQWNRNQPVGL